MDASKIDMKSMAWPIAAGFLIGTAIYQLLAFLWGQIWGLRHVIDWDMYIKLGDRIRFDCGGCISVVAVSILAIGAGVALIKMSHK